MNHDVTHCLDFIPYRCPKSCPRARITDDLNRSGIRPEDVSWANYYGTAECHRKEITNVKSGTADT